MNGLASIIRDRLTWEDLLSAGGVLAIAAVSVFWLLPRLFRRLDERPKDQPRRMMQTAALAARRPLRTLGLWIGLYGIVSLVLKVLPPRTGSVMETFGAAQLFRLGAAAIGIWLLYSVAWAIELRVRRPGRGAKGRLGRYLLPVLIKAARFSGIGVAVYLAVEALHLPHWLREVLAKGLSLFVIAMVAWVIAQAVKVTEKVLIERYDFGIQKNLQNRQIVTQVQVLSKLAYIILGILTVAAALMSFEQVRKLGTSILASAGVVGLIVGFAAQRTIANLFAGLQLAFTQPIRLDDVVIVENEWGVIEEITLTYVVVRIWDLRRLVVPITYFLENPFQNWTRTSADLLGTVFLYVDFTVSVEQVRRELRRIVEQSPYWDKVACELQVTNANERAVELRALVSAADSSAAWNLRCEVREKLIVFVQRNFPNSLPRVRAELERSESAAKAWPPDRAAAV